MSSGKPLSLVPCHLGDKRWKVGYYEKRDVICTWLEINGHLPMLNKQQVMNGIFQRLHGTNRK
jgi:hypothetical protein